MDSTRSKTAAQPAEVDLGLHLPLVGHVVRQLSLRLPAALDRTTLWNLGAIGLAAAARARQPDGRFGTLALRSIRAHILDGIRDAAPMPDDQALATMLGVTTDVLVAARRSAAPTDVPVAPPAVPIAPPRPLSAPSRRTAASVAYAS